MTAAGKIRKVVMTMVKLDRGKLGGGRSLEPGPTSM